MIDKSVKASTTKDGSSMQAPTHMNESRGPMSARRRGLSRWVPQYTAIAPYYVLYLIFGLFPVFFTAWLAFQKWDGFDIATAKFVGLGNFIELLKDGVFWLSVSNTFTLWAMSTIPGLILSMLLALALNANIRFTKTLRIIYLLPNVTSVVAMGILFLSIFSSKFGLANALLSVFHIPPLHWMATPWGIKFAIASLSIWGWVGYNALIFLSALQAVPEELYEAAKLDGAGGWKSFWYITIPQIRPVIIFTIVISTVGGMQSFTESQVMTSGTSSNSSSVGGIGQSGLTMVLYFWAVAFKDRNYGYGAAIAWAVFVIVGFFTFINWRITSKRKGA